MNLKYVCLGCLFMLTTTACKSGGRSVGGHESTTSRPTAFDNDDALLDYTEQVHPNDWWHGPDPIGGRARARIHTEGV